jgi:hypothetical protein
VQALSSSILNVNWVAATDDNTPANQLTYEIHVVEGDNIAFNPSSNSLKFSSQNATSSQLNNLKASTVYTVKLVVIDIQGLKTTSNALIATTEPVPNQAPTNISLISVQSTDSATASLSWSAANDDYTPENQITYEVHLINGNDAVFEPSISTLKFSGNNVFSTRLIGLKPSTFYTIRLQAIDQQGLKSLGQAIGFTTKNVGGLPILNDTGITSCASSSYAFVIHDSCLAPVVGWFKNQDGEIGRDASFIMGKLTKIGGGESGFDFTKISATGQKVAADSPQWSCILDNNTGLMWEVKTDDGGIHDKDNTYTWYNPDSSINGGFAGYENNGKNTYEFVRDVNSQGLCGYNDWRLPTVIELQGIINYQYNNKSLVAIDLNYFNYFQGSLTQSPYALNNYVWHVGNAGVVGSVLKSSNLTAQLVRPYSTTK